jgi:hypothetical protein
MDMDSNGYSLPNPNNQLNNNGLLVFSKLELICHQKNVTKNMVTFFW